MKRFGKIKLNLILEKSSATQKNFPVKLTAS